MNSRNLPLAGAALALALAAVPGRAALIAVYTPPGEPPALEEMAAFARALRNNPDAAPASRFTYRVSAEAVLTGAFSVPADVSAYFWADETVRMAPEYRMEGAGATYVAELNDDSAPAAVPEIPETAKAWSSALRSATVRDGRLGVSYSLAQSGRVTLEAFSPGGGRVNRWQWRENGPGLFQRSVPLPSASSGVLLLRWTAGETRATQKVLIPGPAN